MLSLPELAVPARLLEPAGQDIEPALAAPHRQGLPPCPAVSACSPGPAPAAPWVTPSLTALSIVSFSSLCTRLKCLPRLPLSPPLPSPGCLCCLPTFPPHHPSFLGESSTPAPAAPAEESLATGSSSSPCGQQEQEDSARSCLLPPARAASHSPPACSHPCPALAHPSGPGLPGVVFTPAIPTPLSLDVLHPPSLFPSFLQRPGRRHEDGHCSGVEAWPWQSCFAPSCFLSRRLSYC